MGGMVRCARVSRVFVTEAFAETLRFSTFFVKRDMTIEWARLRPQEPAELADRGITLRGTGGCRGMLLHGLTGCPAELGYIAHWLRGRARYHVTCPRLINHGQPMALLARTTWRELYASARESFLDARSAARAERGPLVVRRLSLAASLSLMLAAEFPAEIHGL